MLKNLSAGFVLLFFGLYLVLGGFQLFVMIMGCACILVAGYFLKKFRQEMTKKAIEYGEKKKAERNFKKHLASGAKSRVKT